jgi:hypothetical protein
VRTVLLDVCALCYRGARACHRAARAAVACRAPCQ